MNVGDILIDNNDNQWITYNIEGDFIYVVDFNTQCKRNILLPSEIKEIIETPNNVGFMFLNRRQKELKDVKEYV